MMFNGIIISLALVPKTLNCHTANMNDSDFRDFYFHVTAGCFTSCRIAYLVCLMIEINGYIFSLYLVCKFL